MGECCVRLGAVRNETHTTLDNYEFYAFHDWHRGFASFSSQSVIFTSVDMDALDHFNSNPKEMNTETRNHSQVATVTTQINGLNCRR